MATRPRVCPPRGVTGSGLQHKDPGATDLPSPLCVSHVSGQNPFNFDHSMLLGPNEIVAPTNYLSTNNDRHSTELKFNWNNKATLKS